MRQTTSWTSADLEVTPGRWQAIRDSGWRVARVQTARAGTISSSVGNCSLSFNDGAMRRSQGRPTLRPGVIFSDDGDVAPDVVWISKERLIAVLGTDGHLHGAPDLVVEVLSPGLKERATRPRSEAKALFQSRSPRVLDHQLAAALRGGVSPAACGAPPHRNALRRRCVGVSPVARPLLPARETVRTCKIRPRAQINTLSAGRL